MTARRPVRRSDEPYRLSPGREARELRRRSRELARKEIGVLEDLIFNRLAEVADAEGTAAALVYNPGASIVLLLPRECRGGGQPA